MSRDSDADLLGVLRDYGIETAKQLADHLEVAAVVIEAAKATEEE